MSFNPSNDEITKIYESFRQNLVDNRGESGKRHELSFVLINFIIAIFRIYGDLSISKIHRQMKRQNHDLCTSLKKDDHLCISRTQLTRVLRILDTDSLNAIVRSHWKIELTKDEWKAVDGKELRGTINKSAGEKRGLNVVLAVGHDSRQQEVIGFYSGSKESERTVVKDALSKNNTHIRNVTFDALHNSESLLTELQKAGKKYLVQIKGNQKKLLGALIDVANSTVPLGIVKTQDRGHGRIDIREYQIFKVAVNDLNERWDNAGISYTVKVTRQREYNSSGKKSKETSFYVSNISEKVLELPKIIRKHWTCEIMNRVRDVNFGEDSLKLLDEEVQKSTASIITAVANGLVKYSDGKNLTELRENLVHDNKFELINRLLAS